MRQTISMESRFGLSIFNIFFAGLIYVPASSSSSSLRSRAFRCFSFQPRHFNTFEKRVWLFCLFWWNGHSSETTSLAGFVNIILFHEIYCIWKLKMMMTHRIKESLTIFIARKIKSDCALLAGLRLRVCVLFLDLLNEYSFIYELQKQYCCLSKWLQDATMRLMRVKLATYVHLRR